MGLTKVQDNFTGRLDLDKDSTQCQFTVVDHHVTVIPLSDEAFERIKELSYNGINDNNNNNIWFFGRSDADRAIAILLKSRMILNLNMHIDMRAAYFSSPMIVQASETSLVDIRSFVRLEFYDGIVDSLLSPGLAFENNIQSGEIKYCEPSSYTQTFDVELDNLKIHVTYTIDTPTRGELSNKVPDLKGQTHAVLRFDFDEPQTIDYIERYYNYAHRLFQFCSGHLNVSTKIRFYCEGNNRPVHVKFIDGYSDYCNELDSTRVISFKLIGGKFVSLFQLLNRKHTDPYMMFLPISNKHEKELSYVQVNDICVALQKEYSRWVEKDEEDRKKKEQEKKQESQLETDKEREELNSDEFDSLKANAELLTYELLETIEKSKIQSDQVKEKARNILNSQLKGYSPSLKEQIIEFYERYKQQLKALTEIDDHDCLGISKFYSDAEFKKLIRKFVDIRNSASHAGITWNGAEEIYYHLVILVYLSVLERAGYKLDDAGAIISWLFQWRF